MSQAQYDELCALVREQTHATGAVVIVIRGDHGSDFSVCTDPTNPALAPVLPQILRDLAHQLDTKADPPSRSKARNRWKSHT